MAIEIPDSVKKYGKMLSKGLVADMAPQIVKGAMVEMLKARKVTVAKASDWVNNNVSLWDTLEPKYQNALVRMRRNSGRVDWLTADWVIEAIKQDLPAVASLFLGWKKGGNWLVRQVEIIKGKLEES